MIVTLGMATFLAGIVLWISGSATIGGISEGLVNLVVGSQFLGVPLNFYYGLALCILLAYVMEYTPIGRRLLIVGRGRDVARLSGIRVSAVRWGALVIAAVMAALAGVLSAGTSGSADPSSVTTLLLPAFAAANGWSTREGWSWCRAASIRMPTPRPSWASSPPTTASRRAPRRRRGVARRRSWTSRSPSHPARSRRSNARSCGWSSPRSR